MRPLLMLGAHCKRVKQRGQQECLVSVTFVKSAGAGTLSGDKPQRNRLLWPLMSSVQAPVAPAFNGSARSVVGDAVQLSDVRKCYDEFVAVSDLTLTIYPGGIYGLL